MSSKEISDIIRYHRKKSGLSTVVYDIEKGKETIRLSTLEKILSALNIKISLESPLMKIYQQEKDEKS